LMGSNWYAAQGYWGCPDCPWTRWDNFEGCEGMRWTVGVSSGFVGVDWVDWGAMDMMLSLIVLEVTGISQHCQKGVTGHNKPQSCLDLSLNTLYPGCSPLQKHVPWHLTPNLSFLSEILRHEVVGQCSAWAEANVQEPHQPPEPIN